MPRLSVVQKTNVTRDITVEIPGEDPDEEPLQIALTIYPNRITIGTGVRAQEVEKTNDIVGTARLFYELVAAWDLTDDKDKVLPFNDDTTQLMSIQVFTTLIKAVMEAVRPNPATASS